MTELYEHHYKKHFSFGKNWQRFLASLTPARIAAAEESLKVFFGMKTLRGKTFLDLGCGSGLFSLAARNLGASVISIDVDEFSIACVTTLKERYYPADTRWLIQHGSALDRRFLAKFKRVDIVYSWGVLHHTGAMWRALENCSALVKDNGLLYIALYNKFEGFPITSARWVHIKAFYAKRGRTVRAFMEWVYVCYYILGLLVSGRNPIRYIREYGRDTTRGMSFLTDVRDWLGGHPYEYASVAEVTTFFSQHGFALRNVKRTQREGCNEFLFARTAPPRTRSRT